MFNKLICIESAGSLTEEALALLNNYAREVVLHHDIPSTPEEVRARMEGADAVLVSYTSRIDGWMLRECSPLLRYVGMTCSLYGPESANVDILTARELGITVTGCHAYGDRGVPEFLIHALTSVLHGFRGWQWKDYPLEITGQKVGVIGLGSTGQLNARALHFFGADLRYYDKFPKPELEAELGIQPMAFDDLLGWADIIVSCLNTNIALMDTRAFSLFGDGKIYINTSIGPAHDLTALEAWLGRPGNFAIGDLQASLDATGRLLERPNVLCAIKPSGMTTQARVRLGEIVLANIAAFLDA